MTNVTDLTDEVLHRLIIIIIKKKKTKQKKAKINIQPILTTFTLQF